MSEQQFPSEENQFPQASAEQVSLLTTEDKAFLAEIEETLLTIRNETFPVDAVKTNPVGLYELFEALTAQRHELKLYTKASRKLDETAHAAIEAMEAAGEQYRVFQRQTIQSLAQNDEKIRDSIRPVLLEVAEIDESVERLWNAFKTIRDGLSVTLRERLKAETEAFKATFRFWHRWFWSSFFERFVKKLEQELVSKNFESLDSFLEGIEFLRTRLNRFLVKHSISRIGQVGAAVDSSKMNVVDVVQDSTLEPNRVAKVLRWGYSWKNDVIRFAEVVVTKNNEDTNNTEREK